MITTSFSQLVSLNFLDHNFLTSLTDRQKKIMAVVILALGCLALILSLYRCCFSTKTEVNDPTDGDDEGREPAIDQAGEKEVRTIMQKLHRHRSSLGVEVLMKDGEAYYEKGEFQNAEDLFKAAIDLEPKNIQALSHCARSLLRQGSPTDAEHYFREALKIGPKNSFALTGLAETLLEQGKPQDAKTEIEKLGMASGLNAWSSFVKGDIHYALNEMNEAQLNYHHALEASKKNHVLGQLTRLYKKGKTPLVLQLCQDLLKEKNASDYQKAIKTFANDLREDKLFADAATVFDALVQYDPKDFFSMSRYGDVLLHLNRPSEALTYLSKAIELESNHLEDVVYLVAVGKTLIAHGWFEVAKGYFYFALKQDPKDLFARTQIAYLYSEEGDLDDAADHFKEVLELEPDNIFALYHYSNVLFKQDKFEEAVDLYNKVLTLDPHYINAVAELAKAKKALDDAQQDVEDKTEV